MKKAFLILTFLLAFNFFSPNTQVLSQKARHVIEYTQEDKQRDVTNDEILKNKVVRYMKMQILLHKISLIDASGGFNTS